MDVSGQNLAMLYEGDAQDRLLVSVQKRVKYRP